MCINGRSMPIYMATIISLASTMWSGVLYTDDNDADANNNDDNTAQLC